MSAPFKQPSQSQRQDAATQTAARQSPQPPAPTVALPYVPTAEEQQYLSDCAAAIVAGCDAAVTAAKVGENSGTDFLNYANGVKALTAAYIEIKTGGKAATGHQGA